MYHRTLLTLAIVVAGCVPTISSTAFLEYPPRPDGSPVHLFSSTTPECDFEEIGLIKVGGRMDAWEPDETKQARKRVREMGGDGIIVDMDAWAAEDRALAGTVIRFTNPECTA